VQRVERVLIAPVVAGGCEPGHVHAGVPQHELDGVVGRRVERKGGQRRKQLHGELLFLLPQLRRRRVASILDPGQPDFSDRDLVPLRRVKAEDMILVPMRRDDDVDAGLAGDRLEIRDDLLDELVAAELALALRMKACIDEDGLLVGQRQQEAVAEADVVHADADRPAHRHRLRSIARAENAATMRLGSRS
jgi:hypothetical protein